MAKLPWVFVAGVAAIAASPMACFFVGDDNGPSGTGNFTGGLGGGNGSGPGAGGGQTTITDACNPVTGAGCPSDGSTCDLNVTTHTFQCFPPPNTVDVCGSCNANNAFCGGELTCVIGQGQGDGICYRYCCTDADCGNGATCDTQLGANALQPAIAGDVVGLCVANLQNDAAYCGPATPSSGGACVVGYGQHPKGDGGTGDGGGAGGHAGHGGSPGTGGSASGNPDGGTTSGGGSNPAGVGGSSPEGAPDGGKGGRFDGGS